MKKSKKKTIKFKPFTEAELLKHRLDRVCNILECSLEDVSTMLDDAFESLGYSQDPEDDFDLKERIQNLSVLAHSIRKAMLESYDKQE